MKYYGLLENKPIKVGIWVCLLALLLLSRDAMYSMMVLDFYTCQYLSLGIIALMGVAFLAVNRKRIKEILLDQRMWLIVVILAVTLIPMLIKRDWQLMYFSIILGALFAVFLSYFLTLEKVALWYVVTMCILGIWSILCAYVLRLAVDSGLAAMTPVTNANGVEFYNFVFAIVPDTYVKHRNFGIFREPGVYQFFILVAVYLNNYLLNWDKERKLWICNGILAVTMLTTFATGGMIELCLLAAVAFADKKWYRNKWILLAAAVLFVGAAAVVVYCISVKNGLYWALWEMVTKFTSNPESTGSRFGSIGLGVQTFFQSPLVGKTVREVLHTMANNSSSTLILYNIFGILGGSLNVAGWVALVWKKNRSIVVNLALLVILFMSFNTQNLTWNLYFWLFPGMALAERGIPFAQKLLRK